MAVVDSSVLIHLSRIGKLFLLERFFKKIIITEDIYNEVKTGIGASEIENATKKWIEIINPKNISKINNFSKLEGIEKPDASIILLAKRKNHILLSNDYTLIRVARSKGVECWWLTTFILQCLKGKIINKDQAKKILFDLVGAGMRLNNVVYATILRHIENN